MSLKQCLVVDGDVFVLGDWVWGGEGSYFLGIWAGNISSPEFGLRYQEKKYLFRKTKRNKYYRNEKPKGN